jgi:hypothetical protein
VKAPAELKLLVAEIEPAAANTTVLRAERAAKARWKGAAGTSDRIIVNPSVREVRQARVALSRLLAGIDLSAGNGPTVSAISSSGVSSVPMASLIALVLFVVPLLMLLLLLALGVPLPPPV